MGSEIDADRRDATRCKRVCGPRRGHCDRSVAGNRAIGSVGRSAALLVLGRWHVAERGVQAPAVVPADSLRDRKLGLVAGHAVTPGLTRMRATFAMGDAGSPYVRFRRSLATGNAHLVLAAARELRQVALDDALRIGLILRDGDPDRYERAAVRWLGRFAPKGRGVSIAELRRAADALGALPDQPSEAVERLQALCLARGVR